MLFFRVAATVAFDIGFLGILARYFPVYHSRMTHQHPKGSASCERRTSGQQLVWRKPDNAFHPRLTSPPRSPQFVGLDRHLDNPIVKFFGALEIKIRFAFVHTIKLALQPDSLPRKAKTLISGGLVEPLLDFLLGECPLVALPASNNVLFELLIKANS